MTIPSKIKGHDSVTKECNTSEVSIDHNHKKQIRSNSTTSQGTETQAKLPCVKTLRKILDACMTLIFSCYPPLLHSPVTVPRRARRHLLKSDQTFSDSFILIRFRVVVFNLELLAGNSH